MQSVAERLLRQHLPYELDMLEWAYVFLHDARFAEQRKDKALTNAAIECFWTHARNLYEFMTRKGKGDFQGVAAATDFVEGSFNPDLPFEEIDDRMNKQIAHLQYERPEFVEGKLGMYDLRRFRDALNRSVKLFEKQLNDDARRVWKIRQSAQCYLVTPSPPSATNTFQVNTTSAFTGIFDFKK